MLHPRFSRLLVLLVSVSLMASRARAASPWDSYVMPSGPYVERVDMSGVEGPLERLLRKVIQLRRRDPYDPIALAADMARLRAFPLVAQVDVDVRAAGRAYTLAFRVRPCRPRPRVRVVKIELAGNERTRAGLIRRFLRQEVGRDAEWERLMEDLGELEDLRLFERVRFHTEPLGAVDAPGGTVDVVLVVDVREGIHRIGAAWATYSTDNPDLGGWGPIVGYVDTNVGGRGAQFALGAMWAETKVFAIGLRLVRPFGWAGRLSIGGGYLDREQELFDRRARPTGGSYRATARTLALLWDQDGRRRRLGWWGGLLLLRTSLGAVDAPPPGSGGFAPVLLAALYLDRRDDRTEPTAGYYLEARLDAGLQWNDDGSPRGRMIRLSPTWRAYHRFGKRHALAWQVRAGLANVGVPFLGEFTLGGFESMRGFPAESMRGNTYGWVTLEYRFPLREFREDMALTGVVFTEVGDAWRREEGGDTPRPRLAGGAGLRGVLGPFVVRLDLAFSAHASGTYFHYGHYF